MGWGDSFKNAWDSATEAAKETASAISETASHVYDASKRAAVKTARAVRDTAVSAYEATRDAVVDAAVATEKAAREGTRDAVRSIGDKAFDALASGSESVKKAADAAKRKLNGAAEAASDAYNKARELLGLEPANSPTQPCPNKEPLTAPVTDKDRDGWMMAPQGPGKPCKAVPPGGGALENARAQSIGSQSDCCKAKRAAGMPPRDIVYVNGINTDRAAHCFTLNAIAAQTCGRVVGVYNATEGMAKDAIQTGQDRRLVKAAAGGGGVPSQDGRNPAVDTMARQVGSALRNGEAPEIWAHSQGGAVASLALFEAKQDRMIATGNPNPLAGMKVRSFGSAAPKWTDGPTYEHYVHVNDATPATFGLGHSDDNDAANAGAGAKVIRFSGDPKGGAFEQQNPRVGWLPTATSNHGIEDTYLKMEKQTNGGCP